MKRAHRRAHALAWLVVVLATAAVLTMGWVARAEVPANADLPATAAATAAAKVG